MVKSIQLGGIITRRPWMLLGFCLCEFRAVSRNYTFIYWYLHKQPGILVRSMACSFRYDWSLETSKSKHPRGKTVFYLLFIRVVPKLVIISFTNTRRQAASIFFSGRICKRPLFAMNQILFEKKKLMRLNFLRFIKMSKCEQNYSIRKTLR